jgi:hypothetical protein
VKNLDEEIKVGYFIMKPIETQEQCDQYSAMATSINDHNSTALPGDVLWAIDDKEDRYEIIESGTVPTEEEALKPRKEDKISESKTALSTYLAAHPIQWSDGKYYSVTTEKQALLTSNLALYQISASAGQPFKLTWNSTGDECVQWTYEELAALALAIGTYVKPFVSRQQELELAIKKCTTQAELDAIEITYDPVLTAYLAEAGKEVVS